MTARAVLSALAGILALAACGPALPVTSPASPGPVTAAPSAAQGPSDGSEHEPVSARHCGVERWPVKTGTDADAAKVDLRVAVPVTVTALGALKAPTVLPQASRVPPVEMTVYQVTATLAEYKREDDSDVHLVLTSGGSTMIAEIPDPPCVGHGSPFLPGITAARAQFGARYHPSDSWQQAGARVTVTGPGFWDDPHGQTGMAPNAIEVHPVLDIQFRAAK